MSKHIKVNIGYNEYDLFQASYDEIVIARHDHRMTEPSGHYQYIIPVRQSKDYVYKINVSSIGCNSGRAEDIIEAFSEWHNAAYRACEKIIEHGNPKTVNRLMVNG